MLVLAYGSNLDLTQMVSRCPSAEPVARATLSNYALAFGGHSSRWGGAVASLVRAHGAIVEGLVYRVSRPDVARLDRFEGVPRVYERVMRAVLDEHGTQCRVHVYLQPERTFVRGVPGPRYFAALWRAYTRWGLDRRNLIEATGEVTR